MKCPFCGFQEDKVVESRSVQDGASTRRRRECLACGRRFTTLEQVVQLPVLVVKRDGRRENFDREKILRGMMLACQKRPVATETLESAVDEIERKVYDLGQKEITSQVIGEMVIDALHRIDQVAYVRFASVYRQFEDIGQFGEIVEMLSRRGRRRRTRRARG
ncbi:MAG: transcriptional regulator NrdR [Armatimonadetes bacterium]|nr:transcriptional regulator NrdR [Armatimonadota bacterium]